MARTESSRRRSRSSSVTVDFKGVEARVRVDAGDHPLEVSEVTREKGDKADYLKWKFTVIEGDCEGGVVYTNTSLSENSLWNLKGLLEALGEDVPDGELDIDLDEMVGKSLMGTVDIEMFEGKPQSRLVDFGPLEKKSKKRNGKGEEREERRGGKDERNGKSDRRGKKAKVKQDEVLDMDTDELEDTVKEYKLDVDLDDFSSMGKKRNAVIDALEKEDLLED